MYKDRQLPVSRHDHGIGGLAATEDTKGSLGLQALIFALVCAAISEIYIPQPVLPVLRAEFGVNETTASWTIAVVILGIALSNLPFGMLSDRYPLRPIILIGGLTVASCGVFCAVTDSLALLIIARFVQGLFIPSLTTCLAAYLARSLPVESLNVVMGSYVSATVAGGLLGRLLGGWIHSPLHWRYAFISASFLVLTSACAAFRWIPRNEETFPVSGGEGFIKLLTTKSCLLIYCTAFGAFFVFSSVFNYLPFYLSGPAFQVPTDLITLLYLSYLTGIIIGPLTGRLSNTLGNGSTMVLGTIIFGLSILTTLVTSLSAIVLSLVGICAGFFSIHASAVGSLNRNLTFGLGRANSLYVLFYYLGGATGITVTGYAYTLSGWGGVVEVALTLLVVPLATGVIELLNEKKGLGRRLGEAGKHRHLRKSL